MRALLPILSLASALLALGVAEAAPPKVVVYPTPAGLAPHEDYKVTVNGKEVFVYKNPIAAIAAFDLEGEAEVVVTSRYDAKWVDVRPLRLGIKPRYEGHTVRFPLKGPANVSVELNADLTRPPLFLFANPIETNRPRAGQPKTRVFEGGKVHDVGLIELTSGETVYIAGGAVVRGAIRTQGGKDIKILGRGILDGTNHAQIPTRTRFVDLRDCARARIEGIILSNSQTWQLVPSNCDDVQIKNVKIISDNGGDDGIDVVRSRNVLVDGAFIRTKDDCVAVKSFAMQPPGAPPVPDDAPGVKNVRVTRSTCWNALWGNAIELGFELRTGAVEDLVFDDLDIIHVERGATLSIHNADRATVRNVRFENIRIEDSRHKLIDLAIFVSRYSRHVTEEEKKHRLLGAWDGVLPIAPERRAEHTKHRGQIENVLFKDIHVVDGPLPFSIFAGWDAEHRIKGVRIQNLTYRGKKLTTGPEAKLTVENAEVRFVD